MKRLMLTLFSAALSVAACADTYQLFWDNGKPSGSFTDPTMWKTVQGGASSDFDKGSNRFFRVEAKTGATNTVLLADYNFQGGINYYLWKTSSLVLDGRGAIFRQTSENEAELVNNTVSYGPFTVRDNDYSLTAFHFGSSDLAHASTVLFQDSLQRFDRTASPHELAWTLQSGYFSFAEPNGANAAHTLSLDNNSTDKIEGRVAIVVAKDAEAVFPKVQYTCNSTNALLMVDGGKLDVLGDFNMDTVNSAAGWRDYACTNNLIVKNGGRFRQLGGGVTFGLNGNHAKRVERVTVTGPGSTYQVASTAGNVTTQCTTEFNVLDGGLFELHKTMYLGSGYASNAKEDSRILVSGAGSKFNGTGATINMGRKTSMVVEDGAEALLYHGVQIGMDISGGSGEDNDSPTMTIRGDDTVVKVVPQSDGQAGVYVGNCTGTGTLNIEGGTLRGSTDDNHIMMRIGSEYNSKGKGVVNMSGGKLMIGNGTYDQCVVGFRSDAEFNLSGGEIAAKCKLTLNYDTARATKTVTSRFCQTGGKATFGGVDLCLLTITSYRHSELRLDGGEFNTAYVTASKSMVAGDVGTATFTADGGTLKPTTSRNTSSEPFVANMDSFLLGPKGLTLDTGSYATLVKGAVGNKAGEQGLLVKKGTAALTLAGGDYTVASTRVDEGTLLLADAAPVFSTALSVGASGTFSLEGAAAGVALKGLAVTNGTLRLDPADVITVDGPVSLEGLRLEFTSLPTLGSATGFLVVSGELSAGTARALRRAIVANVPGEGEHIDVTPTYDAQTGKTTVLFKYAQDAEPITDTVTWNGNGDDWAADANWDGGVPTAAKKAAFPETAVKMVNVASAAKAGAVAFAAGGYALAGAGSLEIAAEQGAAEIASASGAATVDVPVTLDAVTALPVAAGASLTLAKPVSDGGIKKTGAGKLCLAATNDFFKEVSVDGGLNVLADAGAVNGASQVKLGANDTLKICGEGEQRLTMPVSVTSTIADPAIIDAATDVTLDQISVSGALIKRGAGTLTIDATSGKASTLSTAYNTTTDQKPGTAVLGYFPADGTKPSQNDWAGLAVAEGTLVIRGDANSPEVTAVNPVIGMNLTNMDVNAQARLVVDGATLNASTKHAYLGFGASYQSLGHMTKQITPTLELKNGAFLKANTMHIGAQTWGGEGCHPTFAATNSTAYFYTLNFSEDEAETRNAAITAAKDSSVMAGVSFRIQGKFDIDLDHCYLGKGNVSGAKLEDTVPLGVDHFNVAQPGGVMRFRNGTLARVTFSNLQYPTSPIEFLWDDSEWCWSKAYGDFTFAAASVGAKFTMTMQGKGLILKPASGATFTTEVPFCGEGGVQNLGAGTVKFGAGTYRFSGTCYTKAGATTDLSAAGELSDAKFGGAGTVSGATVSNRATVALDAEDDWTVSEVPTFKNCDLTGTTLYFEFGRTSEDPLSRTLPKGLTVAKLVDCTGTPTFKLRGRTTGVAGLTGSFTVDAQTGEVRLTAMHSGFIVVAW